jgi:hypothetical protein
MIRGALESQVNFSDNFVRHFAQRSRSSDVQRQPQIPARRASKFPVNDLQRRAGQQRSS